MSTVKHFPPFWQDSSNKAKLDIVHKILASLKEKDRTQAELMQDPGAGNEGSMIFNELSGGGFITLDQISWRYSLTRRGLEYLDSME